MALPATIRGLNTSTDPESVRQRVEALEHLLEGLFTIPGTNRKIGLDVILDLIPVGGDVVGAALGGYMIWEARNLGPVEMADEPNGGQCWDRLPARPDPGYRRGPRLPVPLEHPQP